MKLYNYFRSSAAYRVRIALNLKGLQPENVFIHLLKNEQQAQDYLSVNPQGLVPTLVDGDEVLTQSLAIIEYLDETHPAPPLLPKAPADRARVRALALAVACDIHPIDNLRVLRYITRVLGASDEQKDAWYEHWIRLGFDAIEARLASDPRTGRFCHGDTPTLADICLIPQCANARRVKMNIDEFPTIARIEREANALSAFADAAPARQPDAA